MDTNTRKNIPFSFRNSILMTNSLEMVLKCWVTPDSKYVIVLHDSKLLVVWEIQTNKRIFIIRITYQMTFYCLSSNKNSFIFAMRNPIKVMEINLFSGEEIERFKEEGDPKKYIDYLRVSPDNSIVILKYNNNKIKFLKENQEKSLDYKLKLSSVTFIDNNVVIIEFMEDNLIKMFNLNSQIEPKELFNINDEFYSALYIEYLKIFIVPNKKGTIDLYDLNLLGVKSYL